MLLSELIASLESLKEEHGDIEVEIDGDGAIGDIRRVEGDSGWDYYYPDRVVIEAD